MAIGMLLGIPVFSFFEWCIKKIIAKVRRIRARKVRKVHHTQVVCEVTPPEEEFPYRRCESWASILRAGDFRGGVA